MELSRGLISARIPSSTLRPAYSPRGCRRLPFGTFSPPQPPSSLEHGRSRALRLLQEWGWSAGSGATTRSSEACLSSLVAVLLNRAVSGIAAVADASSSQSSADILTLALSVTDILAGHVWLSIQPKPISPVVSRGVECKRVGLDVSNSALHELLWTWDSLTTATCCKSLVVVYGGNCILQIRVATGTQEDGNALTVDAQKFIEGSLYKSAMDSKKRTNITINW